MHFADRLYNRITAVNSRVVVGLDPDPARVFCKNSLLSQAFPNKSPGQLLEAFCNLVIEAGGAFACAIKPQSAFFESLGITGLEVLSRCIRKARQMNVPVIFDAKRGDIGNTAKAYANAYLNPSSDFFADALTVNPYLGPDTLEPFIGMANKNKCGLFVLVKTSNPGSSAFQDLKLSEAQEEKTLSTRVAQAVAELGQSNIGRCGFSNTGAVVGATYPEDIKTLRLAMPNSIFLVPGYGAQGGTAEDVKPAFNQEFKGAIVSSSRGIIFAYEKLPANGALKSSLEESIYQSIAEAAEKAREDINSLAS